MSFALILGDVAQMLFVWVVVLASQYIFRYQLQTGLAHGEISVPLVPGFDLLSETPGPIFAAAGSGLLLRYSAIFTLLLLLQEPWVA